VSGPIINNLRRQISDTRPKPGSVVAGFPVAIVKICDLEGLIDRYEALERQLAEVRDFILGNQRRAYDDVLEDYHYEMDTGYLLEAINSGNLNAGGEG
jgi:hypothetical protein